MEIFKLLILSMFYIVPCRDSNPMCAYGRSRSIIFNVFVIGREITFSIRIIYCRVKLYLLLQLPQGRRTDS